MNTHPWLRIGSIGFCAVAGIWVINWLISPSEADLIAEGRDLFVHEWQPGDPLSGEGDGLGPVFNEKSCVACHFQGGVGGGGSVEKNVDSFQVLPNRDNPEMQAGVIHSFATEERYEESLETVRAIHQPIPESTRLVGNCTVRVVGFDPLLTDSMNTPALWGVGLIDAISSHNIKSHRRGRELHRAVAEFSLEFDETRAGRLRTHGIGSVGRFGWRGQFATLEDFVATACAVELGLTNRMRAQDVPREHRPDDDAEYDMTSRQLQALVSYCRNLPRPEQVLPTDSEQLARVQRGEEVFGSVGCADCHTPSMGGVDGVYSDFLLYNLESEISDGYIEQLEVPLPDHLPEPEEWQTPPLWGVADSAPYFHDGSSGSLQNAILRHQGAARHVMKKHKELTQDDRECLIEFLETLKAPQNAERVVSVD